MPRTADTKPRTKRTPAHRGKPAEPRVSRTRKPDDLDADEWQARLRRQFGREQSFGARQPRQRAGVLRVPGEQSAEQGALPRAIRGAALGDNFCSCADFATNDLGTCKHIEFTLGRIERRRGAKAALRQGFRPAYSEVWLRYGGVRCLRFRVGTDCPPELARQGEKLFGDAPRGALAASVAGGLERLLAAAHEAGHEMRCYDDARAFVAELRDREARQRIIDDAYPRGARDVARAGIVKAKLYPYQAEGALFAARAGRALLGDEMGLGKTLQAIAAAELLSRHLGAERVLVVCPTSLKVQWQREIARFTGREAQVVRGLRAAREQQYRADGRIKITHYETLARDLDLIGAWAPDVVIVDEAQRIKNWNTIAARALKRIASPYAIVLTGTPLQNRLEELISIVQLVDRHRLGPTWRLLHEHQRRDDAGRVIGYQALDRIGATLAPVMLRRRKAEVLEQLPERIDNTLFVPMTAQQLVHHSENADVVARIVKRWRNTGFLSDADQRRLTCALQNMRMSCNSTYLLDHESDHGVKCDELATLLDELFEQPDAKVVIFSQWVRTHELIIRRLDARGWGHVLFHGGVPSEQRPALVDRFHDDPACRVFLSTDAGGVGLNLQHAAAAVVNMDMPWNPAVLEQRIGRVHRLGQKRSVQVINFVAQGSIEEGMLSVLQFKRSLFAGVLDGGESDVFLEGTRLAKFMDSVDQVTGAMGSAETAAPSEAETPREAAPAGVAPVEAAPAGVAAEAPAPATDPWAPLIDAGLGLIESLAAARAQGNGASPWIEQDAHDGRSYLRLPLPEPETVQRLASALGALLSGLRPR